MKRYEMKVLVEDAVDGVKVTPTDINYAGRHYDYEGIQEVLKDIRALKIALELVRELISIFGESIVTFSELYSATGVEATGGGITVTYTPEVVETIPIATTEALTKTELRSKQRERFKELSVMAKMDVIERWVEKQEEKLTDALAFLEGEIDKETTEWVEHRIMELRELTREDEDDYDDDYDNNC